MFPEYVEDTLPEGLPEPLRASIVALIKERDIPGLGDFSRAEHMAFANHKLSKEIQIEEAGEVVTYAAGGQKRIERRSAYNRKIAFILASNPIGATQPKIRAAPSAFKKAARRARLRTEAELEGLRKGNERRRIEAEARRAAKEAPTIEV
jgi:hypothetical protein